MGFPTHCKISLVQHLYPHVIKHAVYSRVWFLLLCIITLVMWTENTLSYKPKLWPFCTLWLAASIMLYACIGFSCLFRSHVSNKCAYNTTSPFGFLCNLPQVKYTQGGLENLELARKYFAQALKLNNRNMRALFGLYMVSCSENRHLLFFFSLFFNASEWIQRLWLVHMGAAEVDVSSPCVGKTQFFFFCCNVTRRTFVGHFSVYSRDKQTCDNKRMVEKWQPHHHT